MYEKNKRPYKYRERPYDYRENLIREESRNRKIRKQLIFSNAEIEIIENKMATYGIHTFSEYVRYCLYNNEVTKEQVYNYKYKETNSKRKQICFNDEEIEIINNAMEQLEINNLNLYIKLLIM